MSKDYFLFESESGETAYMAGVVDVLSDKAILLEFSCFGMHSLYHRHFEFISNHSIVSKVKSFISR